MKSCHPFWLIAFLLLLTEFAFSQVKLKTILDTDGLTYKVYLTSNQTFTGINALISSSQITLVVPHGSGNEYFQLSNIKSPNTNMRWTFSGRTDAPSENPDYDYLFFSFINNTAPFIKFDITTNQEILLFTFSRTSKCIGKLYLFNNQFDPFVFPNSIGVNTGNSLTILGAWGDAYKGNTDEQTLVNIVSDKPNPCAGDDIIFTATPTTIGNYNYQWYVNDEPQGSPTPNSFFKYTLPKNESDFQINITVKLIESITNPCDAYTTRKTIKLPIKGLPNAKIDFAGFDCMVLPTTISVKTDALAQYQWQENGIDLLTEQKNTLEVTKSGSYSITINKNACIATSNILKITGITTEEQMTLDVGKDTTILAGASVKLNAKSDKATHFSWIPTQSLSNPNTAQPTAHPQETTQYTLTASVQNGCPTTASLTINVIPPLYIPNAFSPNNDNLNDTWKIENIDIYPEATIKVFNRWGNLIFFSNDYQENWDAQNTQADTYQYVIHTKFKTYKGTIEILR